MSYHKLFLSQTRTHTHTLICFISNDLDINETKNSTTLDLALGGGG